MRSLIIPDVPNACNMLYTIQLPYVQQFFAWHGSHLFIANTNTGAYSELSKGGF